MPKHLSLKNKTRKTKPWKGKIKNKKE
jgi:hypothetical protein